MDPIYPCAAFSAAATRYSEGVWPVRRLSEHIATGQQIEKFSLYGQINGKWKKIFAGTVIGSKRICRFEEARMQYIKLVIEETRCFATIARFEAY